MATVADLYRQYLGREPDAGGLSYWTQAVKGGATAGIDPEEITAFLAAAQAAGEEPRYMADVTTRNVVEKGDEGMFSFSQTPAYEPPARQGDREFEGQKYFEADRLKILEQLKAQQAAGMKYTASFTSDEGKILDDLSKRLAAQGVTDLSDLKPIMSGETLRDTGEGQLERVESSQIGLYNAKTGEQLSMKMLTNNEGKGTTNYQATFVNGIPVFTASKAATGLEQIQQDFGPILSIAASAILPGLSIGGTPLGQLVGSSLGLSGTAAQAVGNALVAGLGTGVVTGDAEKALLAATLVGGGTALTQSGVLGDVFDKLGLSEHKETLGVTGGTTGGPQSFTDALQQAQAGRFGVAGQGVGFQGTDLGAGLAGSNVGTFGNVGTAGFGSALGTAQGVADALVAAGLSQGTANNLAGLTLAGTGATGLLGGAAVTGLGTAGVNALTGGTTATTPTGTGTTTGTPTGTTTGTPTGTTTGLPSGLTNTLGQVGTNLLGSLLGGGTLGSLANAGIDYATSEATQRNLRDTAARIQQQAMEAGRAAQVPFTPYTVTTGAGTTGLTATGATATTAQPYQDIRSAAQQQALSALNAINPAQAAETLYGQVEALAAPGREREQLALQNRLQRQGLMGFGTTVPTVGGARTVNPMFESLLSAQETARAQQALAAQQFGTAEAQRQAQLAQGLLGQAQGIDAQDLAQLAAARGLSSDQLQLALRNAEAQRLSTLQGMQYSVPLYTSAANIRSGQISGLGTQAQNALGGLFGNLLNQAFDPRTISSGLDISGESQATQNLINDLQRYGIF